MPKPKCPRCNSNKDVAYFDEDFGWGDWHCFDCAIYFYDYSKDKQVEPEVMPKTHELKGRPSVSKSLDAS